MVRWTLAILAACSFTACVSGQDPDCSSARSCDECIQLDSRCGWCRNLQKGATTRCRVATQFNRTGECDLADISNPQSTTTIPLLTPTLEQSANITLNLRARESASFDIKVTRQADFPVDVYYLLDNTQRMGFNLVALRNFGSKIIASLQALTPRRRLGFGVFNDKPTSPFFYTKMDGTPFQSPAATDMCGLDDGGLTTRCGTVNSFQHVLNLTDDITAYAAAVNTTLLTNKPEEDIRKGQLDALLQAAVCSQPGWNTYPRGGAIRLIVLATDTEYHSAGDGILGGIVRQHDGKCHLDSKGFYDYSTLQDYPSAGQIREALDANEMIVAFALARIGGRGAVTAAYASLQSSWSGRALIARLDPKNDSTFVDTVVNAAREASEQANIRLSRAVEGITVTVNATCPSGSAVNEGSPIEYCNGMKVNSTATFQVTVTAEDCDKLVNTKNLQLFLSPAYGSVNVDINALCSCPCTAQSQSGSGRCSGLGALTCGQCSCPVGNPGSFCQCNISEVNRVSNTSVCLSPNSGVADLPCSNEGTCEVNDQCVYGCKCRPEYHGRYCACRNSAVCGLHEGLACGGTSRGVCRCADDVACTGCSCQCNVGFNGSDTCQPCSSSLDSCRTGTSGEVCSSNGNCVCGACQCNFGWFGDRCQFCEPRNRTCLSLCQRALPCALAPAACQSLDPTTPCYNCGDGLTASTTRRSSNCTLCPPIEIIPQSAGDMYTFSDSGMVIEARQCPTTQEGGCQVNYYAGGNSANELVRIVRVQRDDARDCPQPFDTLPVVLGIVFGLLGLAVILLVIWKIVTVFLDRREYRSFIEQQKIATWEKESNPIYKNPHQRTVNPTFRGGQ